MAFSKKCIGIIFLTVCVIALASLARCEEDTEREAREITYDDIAPRDYDYLHPPKNLSQPVMVNITISKINIRSIDESDMSFRVTLEMYQSWIDFRLKYPSWATPGFSVLDSGWIDKIWNPKLYFRNAVDGKLDNIISPSSFFWLKVDRSIVYCCRVILTLICEMDLKYFPHDEQECGIQMSSSIYSTNDIILRWWSTTRSPQMVSLQQFEVIDIKWKQFNVPFGHSNLSSLELAVVLDRRTGYYLINVYIPTILIVIMSMLTFWIPPDAVPARVTLGVTSLLTIITKQYQAALPNVSYIVALNVWLSSCIAFVFFSLLEFAAVIALNSKGKQANKVHQHHHHQDFMLPMVMLRSNGTWAMKDNWSNKKDKGNDENKGSTLPKRLDYFSRIFFPLSFIVFAIIYWHVYN